MCYIYGRLYFGIMKFRAKMTSMGDSIHIIIPKAYHQDAKAFLRKIIEVEIKSV